MLVVKLKDRGYYRVKKDPITKSVTFVFGERDEATVFLSDRGTEMVVAQLVAHHYKIEDIMVEVLQGEMGA